MCDTEPSRVLAFACGVTLLHYVGVYMRVPVLPLYAAALGASVADVGLIVGAHMTVTTLSAIPLGRASDDLGRRALLLAGTAVSAATSLLLPAVETRPALIAIYGAAGLGVAAFTPSIMSLVGDVAAPGTVGRAYGWYTMVLYAGMGTGPLLGGFVAQRWGHRPAFVVPGTIITAGILMGAVALPRLKVHGAPRARVANFRPNRVIWAGWTATVSALVPVGALMTFFPLLARERGLPPVLIGLVLSIQSLANTAARLPAGWLLDRSRARRPYAVGGGLGAALGLALIPHVSGAVWLVLLAAVLGAALGVAFVAIGAALSEATAPATRGLAMGGYSTAIYVGLGIGAIGLGPLMATWGYAVGFTLGGVAGALGTCASAILGRPDPAPGPAAGASE